MQRLASLFGLVDPRGRTPLLTRGFAKWTLIAVLALDVAFVALVFWGAPSAAVAQVTGSDAGVTTQAVDEEEGEPAHTAEALRLLGRQLAARVAELDRREAELAELARSERVLAAALPGDAGEETPGPVVEKNPGPSEAFRTLQRAYENMEPETAARALAALAERDSEAVVQMLLGWSPRSSGAILDALATTDPALAADLSYDIWKLEPNGEK